MSAPHTHTHAHIQIDAVDRHKNLATYVSTLTNGHTLVKTYKPGDRNTAIHTPHVNGLRSPDTQPALLHGFRDGKAHTPCT